MSTKQQTDISPVVKQWLVVGLRVLVIILSAIAGDATDVVNVISNTL